MKSFVATLLLIISMVFAQTTFRIVDRPDLYAARFMWDPLEDVMIGATDQNFTVVFNFDGSIPNARMFRVFESNEDGTPVAGGFETSAAGVFQRGMVSVTFDLATYGNNPTDFFYFNVEGDVVFSNEPLDLVGRLRLAPLGGFPPATTTLNVEGGSSSDASLMMPAFASFFAAFLAIF
eukprot:TRINITY_DN67944_c0_g1_i1.p2 TRINITY_DN67944_c0_g1~~TRINITY_DN67944_c0_g1_i1.p2  ORF type:complete len:178 (-),score=32.96 TRINITY_DN67944_c0_g1_i1:62-595(-)